MDLSITKKFIGYTIGRDAYDKIDDICISFGKMYSL